MQKLYSCVLILVFVIGQCIFAQPINKVIISGYGGQHDLDVKTAFLLGYASHNNTSFTGEVILYSNTLQSSFNYAVANDYDLIIRSTSGLSTGLRLAPDYPSVELVMPAGSNLYTQVFFGDVASSPVVITGAGVDSNKTGYKLEFYSIDPITGASLSSYANGYIAGQISFISNTLNVSFDSARTLARTKGSENGYLDFYNGYGKIMPENIITNPLPVELTAFSAKIIGREVILKWQTATETNNYGFEIERKSDKKKSEKWEKIGFVNGNGNSYSPKDYSFIDDKLNSEGAIKYRLKQIDNDGNYEYSEVLTLSINTEVFELYQNYPNPFNPSTIISWQSPVDGDVTIKIYDILGNEVATLINEYREAGSNAVEFNALNLASGIYIYQIEIRNKEFTQTLNRKMTLLK